MAAAFEKRKLYRQTTGQDAQWFPRDNDPDVLNEWCWEAGGPRCIIRGTPAGGAGVHGCLEVGASVVALFYDNHHEKHLQKVILERSVEALAPGTTTVFKDEKLAARSEELKLTDKPRKREKGR